jgi:hypothetical protein
LAKEDISQVSTDINFNMEDPATGDGCQFPFLLTDHYNELKLIRPADTSKQIKGELLE